MGRDNSWQVEGPSVNPYMLYDMYKNRNIVPTGENTLVDMLQNAWDTGKKALQEDFITNVIKKTDPLDLTKVKPQGMTTNQYLQNQASNKGWLMDYIANPLSNPEVQAAANALDKKEIAQHDESVAKYVQDKFARDHTFATTDLIPFLQKASAGRPYDEQARLMHDNVFNVARATTEEALNPNGKLLRELNAQRLLDKKPVILGEDIMRDPDKLLQALREAGGIDNANNIFNTVAGQEGVKSPFAKGPNEARSRADEILGTDGKFARGVQYSRDAEQAYKAFKATFSDMSQLTPQGYEAWKTTFANSIGVDLNSQAAKDIFARTDADVGNYVNNIYSGLTSNYGQLVSEGKTDSISLANRNRVKQEAINFRGKWGNKYINSEYPNIFEYFHSVDDGGRNAIALAALENATGELEKSVDESLTATIDSDRFNKLISDPIASQLYNACVFQLKQAVKDNPELKELGINDNDYRTVAYNFINQAQTFGKPLNDYAIQNGLDRLGKDYLTTWNNTFNAKTFSLLKNKKLDPVDALKYLALKRAQSQKRGNY